MRAICLTRDRDGQTYVYDGENKMVSFNGGASQGGAEYSYDGDGRRVKKVVGAVSTVFVYDVSGQLIAEYSSAAPQANGTRYVTNDHLRSPRVITNSSGVVQARHDYHPFGEEVGLRGGRTAQNGYVGDNLRQKFTAKERDVETGLDYFGARYYSNTQGRFTTPDLPFMDQIVGDSQSWNMYQYVGNNPLRYIDPFGYWKWTEDGFIVWENDSDTWESLATLVGSNAEALQQFFPSTSLGEGVILDIANFNANRGWDPKLDVEWTEIDEREFSLNESRADLHTRFDMFEFYPPAGGGLRTVGPNWSAVGRSTYESVVLRRNLTAAGHAGESLIAHHIVAFAKPAGFARHVLKKFGIRINDAENGVFLEVAAHRALHSEKYFRAVNRVLSHAKTKEDVIAALEYIRTQLANGTFPH